MNFKNALALRKIMICLLVLSATSITWAARKGGDNGDTAPSLGDNPNVRWTLADWLAEKQQFKLQDQWLATHRTEGHFELGAAGGSTSYTLTTNGKNTSQSGSIIEASFFYSIFGIAYEYESSDENWSRSSAEAKFRIFGTHARSSYLNIGGGQRTWSFTNPSSTVANTFAQAQLNLYIVRIFGIEAEYDQYFKGTDSSGTEYSGNKVVYGGFFEFGFLRLGARGFTDTTYKTTSTGGKSGDTRTGSQLELGFFF